MNTVLDGSEELKQVLKAALVKVLEEDRELIKGLLAEVLEDLAFSKAICEGDTLPNVSREQVFEQFEAE